MLSPLVRTSPTDSTSFYGFGVGVQPKSDKGKVISHTGGWPGYRTLLIRWPETDQTAIILSNSESNLPFFRAAVESILNDETLVMPYEHKEVKIDTTILKNYTGKYFGGLTMEFLKKNGKLYRHRNGTPDIELKPESPTKFFYGDGTDRQIEFEVDNNGKVVKAWFLNMGQKGEIKKIE
jgi:CubicO group peptidase (beta-lactamase class C family)